MTHPYIAIADDERRQMLEAIGVKSFDELVADIPQRYYRPTVNVPPALSEQELTAHLAQLAAKNNSTADYSCFMGGDAELHYVPPAVGALVSRGEFLTSYTPYQAEAAQGTLQAGFEFQTVVSELLGTAVANAGMYDGATAFAEACLMACRITKRSRIAVHGSVAPRLRKVLQAYTLWQNIEIHEVDDPAAMDGDYACIAVQSPGKYGYLQDIAAVSEAAHNGGALCVVHTSPFACAMFNPPGELGADIVTAEGQPLGVPLSFGGAYVGLFGCKKEHIRQMPGRLIGATTDTKGNRGFVLTLQTREQHIRRQRATSNICTSTQLIALMVTVYTALLGARGVRQTAELCYHKAQWAAAQIGALDGYDIVADSGGAQQRFNQFAVTCPLKASEVNRLLFANHRIIGGAPIEGEPHTLLFAMTEMNGKSSIERLVTALGEIGGGRK